MDQVSSAKTKQLQNPNFVSSSDACLKIINCLMCYNQSSDPESFVRLSVESLVRKLKEKPQELDELICAVTSAGSQSSKCVTIPKTLDGRIQIGGRKCFPHLTYAKIWRFPDLSKMELRRTQQCNHAYELHGEVVCINPYHYERIVSSASEMDQAYSPETDFIDDYGFMADTPLGANIDLKSSHDSRIARNPGDNQAKSWNSSSGGGPSINQSPSHSNPGMSMSQQIPSSVPQQNNHQNSSSSQQSGQMSNIPNQGHSNLPPVSHMQQILPALTNQRPPEFWCDIAYFELDQQVGELFKVRGQYSRVTVDGYTDPSSPNRFCLGQLSNVHRSEQSEKSRLYIGKGVELDNVGEGDVWIRCLSEFSVFVQSYYLDREAGRAPGDAVHKIYPGAYIKVGSVSDLS
ncbi:hypothetical protein Ciccas_011165 [Cichlidogyrus casuarinus]|uniref:Mothers against decapentaplegic homolog n=1 Tax=Cichlidogyrus casuarinus TaxID=1844966 RepID=A0ABD2PSU6_9PLAT